MNEMRNPMTGETCYQDIIQYGITYTAEKAGTGDTKKAADLLRQLNSEAHSYFRYAVAKKTVKMLQVTDRLVVTGYLVGESEERAIPHQDPLHLLIAVKRKTAALTSLIDGIAAGLLHEYRRLMGEAAEDLKVFVLFEIADEQELQMRRRFQSGAYLLVEPPIDIQCEYAVPG